MTTQSRETEVFSYNIDVLDDTCPSRRVLDLLANKWTVLVIYALSSGTKRNGELQRLVLGITQKMLTQTLRELECNGIVARTVYPVVPPMVEYNLTAMGQTLIEPLKTLCNWAMQHIPEVEASRARFADNKGVN